MTPWDLVVPPPAGLSWPVPIDRDGVRGPTRSAARGPRWRRVAHGLYVPSSAPGDLAEQRTVEASALHPQAVVTGWASLRWRGAQYLDGTAGDGRTELPVALVVGAARPDPRPGVVLRRDRLPAAEVERVRGLRIVTVERAVVDEMRARDDLREAVVVADMAYGARLTSARRMRAHLDARPGIRGRGLCLEALALSDEHSRSPQESRFRLVWVLDAGWLAPVCNRRVLGLDGRFVATPDLVDVERGVVGEYAGSDHRDIGRHASDVAREADLRAVGLEHVEVVGRDLRHPQRVVRRMEEAAARAAPGPRAWRLATPPSPTLDELLDRPARPARSPRGGSRTP